MHGADEDEAAMDPSGDGFVFARSVCMDHCFDLIH
jgi:hypothetical protein